MESAASDIFWGGGGGVKCLFEDGGLQVEFPFRALVQRVFFESFCGLTTSAKQEGTLRPLDRWWNARLIYGKMFG